MSKLSQTKSQTLGSLSAVQTLLQGYPQLIETYKDESNETSFAFMLEILKILGVKETDIIDWVADLLTGKAGDGFLNSLESVVKTVLTANVKQIFGCNLNPMLPTSVMENYGTGIQIDIDKTDLYDILSKCPLNDEGEPFYFDAKVSDYLDSDSNDVGGYDANYRAYRMTTNDLWKSRDFNAFLWYVIHKGDALLMDSDDVTNYWDNRVQFLQQFKKDKNLMENFFAASGDTYPIHVPNSQIEKKRILKCVYDETIVDQRQVGAMTVFLYAPRYYQQRQVVLKGQEYWLNKTIFEFDFDYIYSLKLFNSKTLVASVINSVLGLVTYSIHNSMVEGQIRQAVYNILLADDTESDDTCYFSFDNQTYNQLLVKAQHKHAGTYDYNGRNIPVDMESMRNIVTKISHATTVEQQKQAIKDAYTQVATSFVNNGYIEEKDQFSFGLKVVSDMLNETMIELVMQMLSPKIALLFAINAAVAGDEGSVEGWGDYIKNFNNVIQTTAKQIKNVVLEEMYLWLMKQLDPILNLYLSRLMLEAMNDYRELLTSLWESCTSIGSGYGGNYAGGTVYAIENVDYADIIPEQKAPQKDC